MEQSALKAQLRSELRAKRDRFCLALDPVGQRLAFRTPPTPLREALDRATCVAGYRAMGGEADPAHLLAFAAAQGKTIALPFVERRSLPMRFLAWSPGEPLLPGPFGLEQPDRARAAEVTPDLFLAPLLGFDRRLHRLGQGAAYFDRAFARFPDAVRIGIAWSSQELDMVPDDPWDVPLHAVLTEKEWIA